VQLCAASNAISEQVNHGPSRLTQEKLSAPTLPTVEDMNSLVNCLPSQIHAVLEGQVGHKFWGVYSARAMAMLQVPSDEVYAAFTESADHLARCKLSKAIQARKRPEYRTPQQPRNRLLKRMLPSSLHSSQADQVHDDSFADTPENRPTVSPIQQLQIPAPEVASPAPQFMSEFLCSLVSNCIVRVLDDNATVTRIVWNAYDNKGTTKQICAENQEINNAFTIYCVNI
jgi:hypothetical protein